MTAVAVGGSDAAAARRGIVLMIAAMGCLAAMDTAAKVLVQEHSVWQLLFVRHAFLLALCLIWLGPRRTAAALAGSRRPTLQAVRVLAVLLEMALFMLAVRYLPLADAHAILAASPLVVTALAAPVLGERVGWRRWFAVAAGFVGILIIIRPGFGVFEAAALIPVAGALLWGLFQVLTRLTARSDSAETAFVWLVVAGFVLPGLAMPWLWVTPATLGAGALFVAICLAGAGGHLLLLGALRTAPASTLQPFSYTLLLWATVWGAAAFGDLPDGVTVLGAAVVVSSGLYAWHRARDPSPPVAA